MSKIAIIYSFNSNKTAKAGEKIAEAYGADYLELVNAEEITDELFLSFDRMILGIPTWFDGELPSYWDEFIPALEDLELKGKKIAIYGLADQKGYPENFADGVGIMAKVLLAKGAELIGHTANENYTFEASAALDGDQFMGLILDQENQARLSQKRIEEWVEQLKQDF